MLSLAGRIGLTLLDDWYVVIDYGRDLLAWALRKKESGIYEVLDYNSTLELIDPYGETAIFKRKQQVKFLQNNVIAFQDHA